MEENDEVEVEAGAIKRKATSAIEKSLPQFKKGNTKLDCPASVASKKVGDISAAFLLSSLSIITSGTCR